jgi:hypothetical protein
MNIPQAIISVQEIAEPGQLAGAPGQVQQTFALFPPYWPQFSTGVTTENERPGWGILVTGGAFIPTKPPVVRVGGLWLFQETVQQLSQPSWSRSPLEIARAAVERGLKQMSGLGQGLLTEHALMVAWGEFAQEIGLIDKLKQVAIAQKEVVHTPQAKLMTFLMGILTGIEHLKDLNEGPHPLAHDWPAMRAWGLVALAHYSGVSRTLAACDEETVAAISQVLREVTQPFIAQEVRLLSQQDLPLIVDLDLAPRRVSNTSTTFPEAEFGWQGQEVGLGYEAALAVLTSPTYGRLFLAGFHHPRNTVSLPRLQKMVGMAEVVLGRCPWRRTDLVKQRLQELDQTITQRQDWLLAQVDKQRMLLTRLETLPSEIARLQDEVTELEALYQSQGRPERKHSRLAKTRRRLSSAQTKLKKTPSQLQKAEQAAAVHRQRLAQLQTERDQLVAHLAQLQVDNENNSNPATIILRLDAGFGTGPNITWLIEMGYLVYTKAHNAQVAASLLSKLDPNTAWAKVGKNADMIDCGQHHIAHCPYPLTLALERFHTPAGLKHSTLIAYRDDGQSLTLPAWFDFYNARQLIEAGIKETNVVFKMHPLKMRSPGGIALQEQFALFAANFVRWATQWLRQRVSHSTPRFDGALARVKTMVRVAANTSAWVIGKEDYLLLKFDGTGAYPGVELRLAGTWRIRPPILPQKVQLFDFRDDFPPGCT